MTTFKNKKEQKARQDAYFEEIYATYAQDIRNYLLARIDNVDDTEDIFQNVFARLYKKITAIDESIKNLRSYLYALARFSHIDFYRGKSPEEDIEERFDLQAPAEPENFLAWKVESILECCLIAPVLSPRQQICLRMHTIGGLSQRDIAEFLEVSRRIIRTDLEKGYRILRAYYKLEGLTPEYVTVG